MTVRIPTERLILRQFRLDDVDDMLEFLSHPSVARVTPNIKATETGLRDYIAAQRSYQLFELDKCYDLALERRADAKVLGLLSMVAREHRQGEIGWGLGIDHRGRGYATEGARALISYCFEMLDYHRIYAITTSLNVGSLRLMERLGMRQEARLQEAEFRDGEWLDRLIYAVLAREWPTVTEYLLSS
jgi:RimJ/RimL family protein N-acetyltransferase